MSERGSFLTQYIYCAKCLDAARTVLIGQTKYLCSAQVPHWNPDKEGPELPIIAGKVGGLHAGEEIETFVEEYIPLLEGTICHPLRIAVLAESGDAFFNVHPKGPTRALIEMKPHGELEH